MLHAASVLLGGLWLYACVYQQVGEKAVLLIGLFSNISPHICQVEKAILVHHEEASIFQAIDCMAHAWFRYPHVPGHTIGVMSHFWTLQDGQDTIRVGIYGGAGFVSVSEAALRRNGMPLSLQQDFLTSIDKVWDEPVDLMLGNHPFHNDTYQKYARLCQGDKDAFLDPGEWHRFLNELRTRYQTFLAMTPEQVEAMYAKSQINDYYKIL